MRIRNIIYICIYNIKNSKHWKSIFRCACNIFVFAYKALHVFFSAKCCMLKIIFFNFSFIIFLFAKAAVALAVG